MPLLADLSGLAVGRRGFAGPGRAQVASVAVRFFTLEAELASATLGLRLLGGGRG